MTDPSPGGEAPMPEVPVSGRPPAHGDPFLAFTRPDGAREVVSLAGRARLSVGRREENDIPLTWDTRVSRLHAEIVRVGEDWVVVDDGLSANGTWVGDERVAGRRRLSDGDLVRVGASVLSFYSPTDASASTSLSQSVAALARISPAQRRVLVALCRPYLGAGRLVPPTTAELAAELHLSTDSIKTHLKALFDAFEMDDVPSRQKRSALVERAVRAGIVREHDVRDPDR